uniref:Uncharacterized protein n=1 Tax=Triticum urartu TaxID=4572 RepID=A0A8R7UPY0_TRIUA
MSTVAEEWVIENIWAKKLLFSRWLNLAPASAAIAYYFNRKPQMIEALCKLSFNGNSHNRAFYV